MPEKSSPQAIPRRADRLALRIYPPLLLLSTACAAVFCYLYITKPITLRTEISDQALPHVPSTSETMPPAPSSKNEVIDPAPAAELPAPQITAAIEPELPANQEISAAPLLPSADHLPGERTSTSPPPSVATPPPTSPESPYQPTTLAIQQPLAIGDPDSQAFQFTLQFPALYRSGSLRWTPDQRDAWEKLLTRMITHQQECQRLQLEAAELLDAWNQLIRDSSPTQLLSPTPSK